METLRISSLLRLRPEVMERAKRKAKQQKMSFNAYVEQVIERDLRPEMPVLPNDFEVSEEIMHFSVNNWTEPSKEDLAADPRLAHILGYED